MIIRNQFQNLKETTLGNHQSYFLHSSTSNKEVLFVVAFLWCFIDNARFIDTQSTFLLCHMYIDLFDMQMHM